LHHLNNINFHFEAGILSKLPEEGLRKAKDKFRFEGYGASIAGVDSFGSNYEEEFKAFAASYKK